MGQANEFITDNSICIRAQKGTDFEHNCVYCIMSHSLVCVCVQVRGLCELKIKQLHVSTRVYCTILSSRIIIVIHYCTKIYHKYFYTSSGHSPMPLGMASLYRRPG